MMRSTTKLWLCIATTLTLGAAACGDHCVCNCTHQLGGEWQWGAGGMHNKERIFAG
jgi:hypothetical protein